jgi:TetR/AcrR family transcriptional repressor of nem operon
MAQSRGGETKEKILQAAEALVLEHGFGATSIDQILAKTGITKGAFFYHFKSKADLAQALIGRYVRRDDDLLHTYIAKAEKLSRDPLQQILIFIGLTEELLRELEQPHPGCMIASFLYQFEEFNVDTKSAVINGFDEWHRVLDEKFSRVIEQNTPRLSVTPRQLVDNFLALFEGGTVISKMSSNPKALAEQITHYKNYIELLFGQV